MVLTMTPMQTKKRSAPKSALEGILYNIKRLFDDASFKKLSEEWDRAFKMRKAKYRDLAGFQKSMNDTSLSDSERERCRMLYNKLMPEYSKVMATEKSLRQRLNTKLVDTGKRKIDDILGKEDIPALEGVIESVGKQAQKMSVVVDYFLKKQRRATAQIIDGSIDDKVELCNLRLKELLHYAKNLNSVDQSTLVFIVPIIKPDGTIDGNIHRLKCKLQEGQTLSKIELRQLIMHGINYYTTVLRRIREDQDDELVKNFSLLIKDLRDSSSK